MAQSDLECANIALHHIGAKSISALAGTSVEALACNTEIPICKASLLRLHPWNFAVKRVRLEPSWVTITGIGPNPPDAEYLITKAVHGRSTGDRVTVDSVVGGYSGANGTWVITKVNANDFYLNDSGPTGTYAFVSGRYCLAAPFEYAYEIALPTDWLRNLRVFTDEEGQTDAEYQLEGSKLYTDACPIYLKYLYNVTDYTTMTTMFYETLALYLAWKICFRITQDKGLRQQLWEEFRRYLPITRFVDATENPVEVLGASDWVDSRY